MMILAGGYQQMLIFNLSKEYAPKLTLQPHHSFYRCVTLNRSSN
ncbi:MAG: hypothetical protein RMY36_005745 [Nostoc sp. SerVER01]|nr:hypothetical protein [Nostoc sp. SerVER01]MDZ8026842.1 hypothetical protein [Nostoc sp. DedQUE11]MDZ8080121.1 hypothetical protein [Nostoc sp. DcaGUA01]MDZ8239808.1 hypothetical protein [Nostoc sp. ChiQUE01a]